MKKRLDEWYNTHKFTIHCVCISIQLVGIAIYCFAGGTFWAFVLNIIGLMINCLTAKHVWRTSGPLKLTYSPSMNDSLSAIIIKQRYRSKNKQRVIPFNDKLIVINLKDCSVPHDRFTNAILYNFIEYRHPDGESTKGCKFTELPEMDLKNKTNEQIAKKVSNLMAFL